MNRQQKRKMFKEARSKLTDEQFERYKNMAVNETINFEVERRVSDIWRKMSGELINIMRTNRISEERIKKIVSEFAEEMEKQFKNENEGDGDCEEISEPARTQ